MKQASDKNAIRNKKLPGRRRAHHTRRGSGVHRAGHVLVRALFGNPNKLRVRIPLLFEVEGDGLIPVVGALFLCAMVIAWVAFREGI
jgi:hypothetical protein